ncbi:Translation initiation factor IF-2 [compost metagenome]
MIRLLREDKIIYEGKIASLKRFKDDAKEVASGYECGIGIENYNDIKVGDMMEAYIKKEVARELEGGAN